MEPEQLLAHAEFVRALARSLVRDPASAQDLEQETWLRALRSPPRGATRLRAWLATVMKNLARNQARSQSRALQREQAHATASDSPQAIEALEQAQAMQSLATQVLKLAEPYRSTLIALYYQGLRAAELAEREDVALATVHSRHQRALQLLRERLDRGPGGREAWRPALLALCGWEPAGRSLWPLGLGIAALLLVGWWWHSYSGSEPQRAPNIASSVESASSARATSNEVELDTARAARAALHTQPELAQLKLQVVDHRAQALAGITLRHLLPDNQTQMLAKSDDQGWVQFDSARELGLFTVMERDWAALEYHSPVRQADGSWLPGKLVLARAGVLQVRVVDARGQAIAQASVVLQRAPWELATLGPLPWGTPYALHVLSGVTDAQGEWRAEGVWPEQDLELRVHVGRAQLRARQVSAAGRLVSDREPGEALRVRAGEERVVEARWQALPALELQLTRADAAPLSAVDVWVLNAEPEEGSADPVVAHMHVPSPSSTLLWNLEVPDASTPRLLWVSDQVLPELSAGFLSSTAKAWGTERLALAQAAWTNQNKLELRLEPAVQLSVRCVGYRSSSNLRLQLMPRDGPSQLPFTMRIQHLTPGEFQVSGLFPGCYALELEEPSEDEWLLQRVEPLCAPGPLHELDWNPKRTRKTVARTATIEARIRRHPERLLAVELWNSAGERQGPRHFVPSAGAFQIAGVPFGSYSVRCGAPADLDRGHTARELALEVGEQGCLLELDLR